VRNRANFAAAALLVISAGASALLLDAIQKARPNAALEDAIYVTSPEAIRHMSLGYNGLMADVYWTRVVQYFGNRHREYSMEYRSLKPLLDITTELDPHLIVAYEFGSTFLAQPPPEGAGDPDAAIALINRGIENNPGYWRFYYTLGYIYYLEKRDPASAAKAFEAGAAKPGAHFWMKIMAALMESDAGSINTARYLWSRIYEESQDPQVRDNARHRLMALDVDEGIPQLEQIIAQYHQKTGDWPSSWQQLIQAHLLRGIPLDPAGAPYVLTPGGRVEVADYKKLPFIHEGLPPGVKPLNVIYSSGSKPDTSKKQ
jgi:tetratricopeptide (TPR) repeat protein